MRYAELMRRQARHLLDRAALQEGRATTPADMAEVLRLERHAARALAEAAYSEQLEQKGFNTRQQAALRRVHRTPAPAGAPGRSQIF